METKNKFLLLIIILIVLGYLGTKEALAFCSPVDANDTLSPSFVVGQTTTKTEEINKLCQDKSTTRCGCPTDKANYHCEVVQNGDIYEEHWTCVSKSQPSPSPGNGESKPTAAYTFETGIPGIAKKGETLPTSGISNLVNKIIVFVFALAGLLSMAMIIYAGVEISISAGNANLQRDAKDRLLWAIVGLVFLFTSYILLYTINPELVQIKEPNPPPYSPGLGGDGGHGEIPPGPSGPIPKAELDQVIDREYLDAGGFTGALAQAINNSLRNPSYYGENYYCNTWVQAVYSKAGKNLSGGATEMYYRATEVSGQPQFGDLVFWCNPANAGFTNCSPQNADNHIGIYVGTTKDGKKLVAQCGWKVSNNQCDSRCPCIMELSDIPTYNNQYLTVQCCRRP